MRTIKFRAWHNDKMHKINTLGFNDGGIKESMSFAHKDMNEFMEEGCVILYNTIFMQFTGLLDKKGVEIYEGDIDPKKGVVEWVQDMCEYTFESKEGSECLTATLDDIEITGNIYENPEMK